MELPSPGTGRGRGGDPGKGGRGGEGATGEGVPARPAGVGAPRGRRRLRVAASFPGWQGREKVRPAMEVGYPRPGPVPIPVRILLPLPGFSGTCL